jgi:hypothetical protein
VCFRYPYRLKLGVQHLMTLVIGFGIVHLRHKVLQGAPRSQRAFTLSAAKLIQFVPEVDSHCIGHRVIDLNQHHRRRRALKH